MRSEKPPAAVGRSEILRPLRRLAFETTILLGLLLLTATPLTAQTAGTLRWMYEIDYLQGGIWNSSPTIGRDGTIYLGTAGYDDPWRGELHAIRPDGTTSWVFSEPDHYVETTPAIARDGTLYIGTWDDHLYAVNPDGTEKWRHNVFDDHESSAAIAADGTIYVGRDNPCEKLIALYPDGQWKWGFDDNCTDGIYSSPAVGPDGIIYAHSRDQNLYAIYPDGTLKWQLVIGTCVGWARSSPAIAFDGTIYVASDDGTLYAVNPDGSLRWTLDSPGGQVCLGSSSPIIGPDGAIYFGYSTYQRAVNPDGTLRWDFESGNSDRLGESTIAEDGTVYVGGSNGTLYALNPSGALDWSYSAASTGTILSPAIGDDGTIYFSAESSCLPCGDAALYALYGDSGGLADSAWPIFRQNSRRTGRADYSVIPLTLGESRLGTIPPQGAHHYSVEVAAEESLLVEVEPGAGVTSLLVNGQRDGETYSTGSQTPRDRYELLISPTASGSYLLTVFGGDVDVNGGEYTITAHYVSRHLSDFDPRSAGNGGLASLLVTGLGFDEGMTVELTNGGPLLTASEVTTSSLTEMLARFDLTGASVGTYDLRVVWPDMSSQTLTAAFEVTTGIGAQLEARLVAPEFVRAGRRYVVWLEYENSGDADMLAPLFTVESTAEISADPDHIEGHRVDVLGVGSSADPHVLRVGEQGRVPIYFINPAVDPADFTLAEVIDDGTAIHWADQKDGMKPPGMDSAEWDALWPALIARLGNTWSDYIGVLRTEAQRIAERGLPAYDVGRLLEIEIGLAGGLPTASISGILRHADTHEPLPGVMLRARSTDGTVLVETVSRYHPPGQVVFAGLADGSYEIYVEGYYFDPPVEVDVLGVDLNDLELQAHEFPAEPDIADQGDPQHTPAAVMGDAGTLYLVWQQGDEIWWAIDPGTGWSESGPIPNAIGSRPIVAFDAALLDSGSTPGLFAAWESGGPVTTIEWSVGRFVAEGIDWTEPQSLTADVYDDFGLAIVTDIQSEPVVLWLQKDYSLEDDTDLYFQVVDVTGPLAPDTFDSGVSSVDANPLDFCPPTIKILGALPSSIPIIGGKWGFSSWAQGCELLNQCNPNPTPSVGLEIPLGKLAKFQGTVGMSFKFQTEPCACEYLLTEAALIANNVGISINQPVYKMPLILGKVPVGMAGLDLQVSGNLIGNLVWVTNFPDLGASQGTLDLVMGYAIVGKVTFYFGLEGTVTGSAEVSWRNGPPNYDIKFLGECVKLEGVADMGFGTVQESYCIDWGSTCNPRCSTNPFSPEPNASGDLRFEGLRYGPEMTEVESTWTLEYTKHALVGTGSIYEGNPVLGDISGDLFTDALPSVAKSASDDVLLVWAKAEAASNLGARVWAADWAVGSWGSPVALTPTVNFNKDPVVVFDSTGIAMVVWSQASNAGLDFDTSPVEDLVAATELADLYFSRRISNTWSAPAPLAALTGRDEQPALAARPSGELTTAWLNQDASGDWTLYSSIWNGSAWSAPLAVATPALAYRPVVFYQGATPTILWTQDDDDDTDSVDDWTLYRSDWNGSVWSTPAPVELPIPETLQQARRDSNGTEAIDFPDPPSSCCATSCDSSGSSGASSPDSQQNNFDRTRSNIVGGIDPNEKVGPLGVGNERYIQAGDVLDYVVHFENLPTATAPAQEVFVDDCLSRNLDWTSFRLKEVAFGDVLLPNQTDGALFTERVTIPDYRDADDPEWWVDIEPELDLASGCLVITFRTLDPATGELPSDPFAGFLPPEDGTGRGQGYVSFSVQSKSDLVDGTEITNQASIVFDTNDPIVTNTTSNIIGQPTESHILTVSIAGQGRVVSDPAGIDCGGDCSESFPSGTRVDLLGVPDPGMTLFAWGGDPDCSDGTVTTDSDKSCTAEFRTIDIFADGFESGDTSAWSRAQP